MEQNKAYDYWLRSVPGIGSKTIRSLWDKNISSKELYELPEKQLTSLFSEKQVAAVTESKKKSVPQKAYEKLQKDQIQMVSLWDPHYPEKLRQIADPPSVLFYKGNLPQKGQKMIAIIGARNCSEYGRSAAKWFGEELGRNQVTVISGMARGVDGISQESALMAGGSSIGVLGCGVNVCYPPENRNLYNQLSRSGGLLSEYLPYTAARAELFPPRNRIISALSDAVLVIEAREKSGTLITVEMALEQGKEVYALPGRVTDKLSEGCSRLLLEGAGIAVSPQQMLTEIYGEPEKELTDMQRQIIDCLDTAPLHINQIAEKTKLPIQRVGEELFSVTLSGFATQTGALWYSLGGRKPKNSEK